MAQTTTQKLRKRLGREGRFDFTQKRGGQDVQISTLTQCTKNKRQSLDSSQRKHKHRMYE